MINTRTEKVIDVQDWDTLVQKTYGRIYSFQQQDGCKERQRVYLKQMLSSDPEYSFGLSLWWQRNFYPDVQMVANDLFEKGLIEAGDYVIDIDW